MPISRTYLLTPNDRVLSSSSIDSVTVTLTTIDSTNNARCPAVLEMTRSEDEWMGTLRIDSLIGIDGHKKEYAQGIPRDIKLKEFKLDEVASSQE